MEIRFTVSGLPPKKDSASSMWNQENQVEAIIKLRKAALCAREEAGLDVFRGDFGLKVKLFLPKEYRGGNIADLDNLIGGICDALQRFGGEDENFHNRFKEDPNLKDIYPTEPILIEDDKYLVYLKAEEIFCDIKEPYYVVTVFSCIDNNR